VKLQPVVRRSAKSSVNASAAVPVLVSVCGTSTVAPACVSSMLFAARTALTLVAAATPTVVLTMFESRETGWEATVAVALARFWITLPGSAAALATAATKATQADARRTKRPARPAIPLSLVVMCICCVPACLFAGACARKLLRKEEAPFSGAPPKSPGSHQGGRADQVE
jgi:hypothetical protein